MIGIKLDAIRITKREHQLLMQEEITQEELEELIKKIDYPDWYELKRISKRGLLLGVDWDTMDYVVIPWKQLKRHVLLFGVTGAGKTFFTLSVLSSWLLERIANPNLRASPIVIDNLGNFASFGIKIWDEFYKDVYSHLGSKEELLEKARSHVLHIGVVPLEWQERAFVLVQKERITNFISFLKHLGAEISEKAKQRLIQILKEYEYDGRLVEQFDIKDFIEELEEAGLYELQSVLDTLQEFVEEYGEEVFKSRKPERKITIIDASRSVEKWIFHYSYLKAIYLEIRREPFKYLGKFNFMVFIDEYNDILDDCELIRSKILRDKREGYYANEFRSFILRLWREGRNYGFSTWISTQSPYQLLVREGRRLGNIQTRIWGYLGNDIEKLVRMERKDISRILDILEQESKLGGWISKPRKGQFIIESENDELNGVMLKIFPPLFVQGV